MRLHAYSFLEQDTPHTLFWEKVSLMNLYQRMPYIYTREMLKNEEGKTVLESRETKYAARVCKTCTGD